MVNKSRVLNGRKAVDAYRKAHHILHSKPWHKGVPEEHTPLLKAMVNALEKQGFISIEKEFEPKKTEILTKFFDESDLLNIQELWFIDREDFDKRATAEDKETLTSKWK